LGNIIKLFSVIGVYNMHLKEIEIAMSRASEAPPVCITNFEGEEIDIVAAYYWLISSNRYH
jgi:hypothetical protein